MKAVQWSESDLLPFGKGYSRPLQFLNTWAERANDKQGAGFSLEQSLRRSSPLLPAGHLRRTLGDHPKCLISGCSIAENPRSLAAFLTAHELKKPEIHVIDLIDLTKIWMPERSVHYHVADASDLRGLFADECFDLIVQDHLLNCAPISEYAGILGEMARILRPGGLILLNYTDCRRFAFDRISQFGKTFSLLSGNKYAVRTPRWRKCNSATYELIQTSSGFTVVTEPWGNLEFFLSFADFELRLAQSSLVIQDRLSVDIVDPNGLPCHRNYCVVTRL